ncbi:MAG: 4-(cytidine 5'-diphospho)-2-C-methyl-D-erythritol kinase [Ignavibacteriaceae bacterium]|nr:4-(cytidine 5'-diphospho)-2-C-methyl-D-erythritol kinase [Ignavibacteriaceae bacterium]
MEKLIVKSPAKINLGLNVIKKREDGYHNLETVFLPILLSDKITFSKSDKLKIETNSDILNRLSNNLVLKAIQLLEEKTNQKIFLDIHIDKIIPIGGGLGGGSSNAAITLKTVNKMLELGLKFEDLSRLALDLGSDIPYFLNPVVAFAESRGEILHSLNIELPYPILIVNPGIKIDTVWAFKKIKPAKPNYSLRNILNSDLSDLNYLKEFVTNDFEEIVFKEFPEINDIKDKLYLQGAQFALMSGTGSTVYGIFSNLQKAYWAEDFFKQKYFTFLHNPFNKGSIT